MNLEQQPMKLFHQRFGIALPSLEECQGVVTLILGKAFDPIKFFEQSKDLISVTFFWDGCRQP